MQMKFSGILLVFTAFFLIGTLNSCRKIEGCTDVTALNYDPEAEVDKGCIYDGLIPVEMHIHQKMGLDELIEEATYSINGVQTTLNLVQFYISAVTLVDANGNETPADSVYLLISPEIDEYSLGSFPAGNYTKVMFDVGIDSVVNHSDPSKYPIGNPLGAQFPNMHWGWDFGYIFVRIDGIADVTGDGMPDSPDGLFEMHLGSDGFIATIEIDYPLTVGSTEENIFHVDVQWETFFTGVDMANDNTTHTMDNLPLSYLIYDNIFNMFSADID